MNYHVTVIGGGPSGLMAAIAAAEQGVSTLLIEKGKKLGTKLAISGGGRCNVTNRLPEEEVIKHIPGNGKFLYSPFSVFNNYDIIDFFEGLGVALKEEDHGRMFPVSNKAKDVVQALLNRMDELNIEVRKETPVEAIHYGENEHEIILKSKEKIRTNAVVIAAGGKAVPHTGSTGDGYAWAKKAGHTITKLFPTEVPLLSKDPVITQKTLQGLSLRGVNVSVLNPKGKKIITHRMDMLFTHFGLSGPAVLRCSQYVVKELMKGHSPVQVEIDALPDQHEQSLLDELQKTMQDQPKKAFRNIVKGMVPERLLDYVLDQSEIDREDKAANLSNQQLHQFVQLLKHFTVHVHDSQPLEKAFVTGGGVSIKEIVPNTMQSKFMQGLYFCGEVLDIHGYTGGYNITSAMVTGRVAGMHAAWESMG
ncbi:aminoacetone oxidase family FAD-binding enzyme [Halobacillus litoralis]|uniref:Aminoacetone oxidase family FAD-binding enzyme n=1 Tax=Halobacillus litoralis TaxID=45668 RepID=A0A845E1D8_9BACI|nr:MULTISPECIES: NAD(P)/FAD-dependent oxidoreductase [Halobacillus]MYL20097.1 aminoacetone oxidase family FAD-binding enzyme [Halobacillus litoralis]MYL29229.1 aminoacetone oxidase family FAD-binding enzyme [Halobacillus halophilus]MYL38919.1 aminoacetone oxidase family FAD-binding enzyme [Halobacillus litoralis]